MNKERELLGRWHHGDLLPEEYMKLMKETKELLAEQPEQEPVAWMYDWNISGDEEYGDTKYDALTRAESITNNRAITNIQPLYTTPKREPLSESKIAAIWDDSDKTDVAITRAIEKAHGITGGGE
jgi:hypothetical protein